MESYFACDIFEWCEVIMPLRALARESILVVHM